MNSSHDLAKKLIKEPQTLNKMLYIKYGDISEDLNLMHIDALLYGKNCHYLTVYKEHMIMDYIDEFLKRFYNSNEIDERLLKISNYYKNYLKFFCNPFFRNFKDNEVVQEYGDRKAEIYYKNNYGEQKNKKKEKLVDENIDSMKEEKSFDEKLKKNKNNIKKLLTTTIRNYIDINPITDLNNSLSESNMMNLSFYKNCKAFENSRTLFDNDEISKLNLSLKTNILTKRSKENSIVNLLLNSTRNVTQNIPNYQSQEINSNYKSKINYVPQKSRVAAQTIQQALQPITNFNLNVNIAIPNSQPSKIKSDFSSSKNILLKIENKHIDNRVYVNNLNQPIINNIVKNTENLLQNIFNSTPDSAKNVNTLFRKINFHEIKKFKINTHNGKNLFNNSNNYNSEQFLQKLKSNGINLLSRMNSKNNSKDLNDHNNILIKENLNFQKNNSNVNFILNPNSNFSLKKISQRVGSTSPKLKKLNINIKKKNIKSITSSFRNKSTINSLNTINLTRNKDSPKKTINENSNKSKISNYKNISNKLLSKSQSSLKEFLSKNKNISSDFKNKNTSSEFKIGNTIESQTQSNPTSLKLFYKGAQNLHQNSIENPHNLINNGKNNFSRNKSLNLWKISTTNSNKETKEDIFKTNTKLQEFLNNKINEKKAVIKRNKNNSLYLKNVQKVNSKSLRNDSLPKNDTSNKNQTLSISTFQTPCNKDRIQSNLGSNRFSAKNLNNKWLPDKFSTSKNTKTAITYCNKLFKVNRKTDELIKLYSK